MCGITAYAQPYQKVPLFGEALQKLPEATNSFVYTDSRGYTWMSSMAGLIRYDGIQVDFFTGEAQGLKSNNVQSSFFEDKHGNLWFSTFSAIQVYNRLSGKIRALDQLIDRQGKRIEIEYHVIDLIGNELWVKANQELHILDIRTLKSHYLCGIEGIRFSLQQNKDTTNLLGVYHIEPGVLIRKFYQGKLIASENKIKLNGPGTHFYHVLPTKFNQFLLFSNEGLFRYNSANKKLLCLAKGKFPSGAQGKMGLVINAKSRGIWWLPKKDTTQVIELQLNRNEGTPFQVAANELNLDRCNTLWVSKHNTGVFHTSLDAPRFNAALFPNREEQNTVFLFQHRGQVHTALSVASKLFKVTSFPNLASVPTYDAYASKLISNYQKHLSLDEQQRVWLCADDQIHCFDPTTGTWQKIAVSKDRETFTSLIHLDSGQKVVTAQGGLYSLTQQTDKRYIVKRIPHLSAATTLGFRSSSNELYLNCNEKELIVLDPQNDFKIKARKAINSRIYAFHESLINADSLWFGTDNGLLLFNRQTHDYQYVVKNAEFQVVYGIQEDRRGRLWLSTNNGIWAYHPRRNEVWHFSQADGLPSNQFCPGNSLTDLLGRIWFASSRGLCQFHPDSIRPYPHMPNVLLTQLWINNAHYNGDTAVSEKKAFRLNYQDRYLIFEPRAVGAFQSSLSKIRFRLKGSSSNWQIISNGEKIRYNQLAPGKYLLEMQSINAHGIRSNVKRITLSVAPPIWQQPWFIALIMVLLVTIGFVSSNWYQRNRLRKAELLRKIAETEKIALLAQINPHFMSNALNTAAYLIHNGQQGETEQYLSQFADLMRKVLESSRAKKVRLEDELAILGLYLEVNRYQLPQGLDYVIQIDEDIDDFSTFIPTMLLQPLLENSIKHGLFHQKTPGSIIIEFGWDADCLHCSITDNGIGRVAAQAYASTVHEHVSHGLQITRERLSLMGGGGGKLHIQDLYTPEGLAEGTRVDLWIPALECSEDDIKNS